MEEKASTIITQTIEELITAMGFNGSVSHEKSPDGEESYVFNIATSSDDSSYMIGQHGINLQAIQHVARLIVRKKITEKIHFTLDINDYRRQKNQSIIEQAREAAKEAISQKRSVIMKPMSTYERRIVHLELSKNAEVATESVGEGESRKIIVKPSGSLD